MPIGTGAFMDSSRVQEHLSTSGNDDSLDGPNGAWTTLVGEGTPLVDPDSDRRTFVWRPPEGVTVPDDAVVHLHVNRLTDKDHHERGIMSRVAGTDAWVLTLSVPETIRASYGFTIRYPTEATTHRPPKHNHYDTFLDPHSSLAPLVDDGEFRGLSVLAGRLAPPLPEWETPDHSLAEHELRGTVDQADLSLELDTATPPSAPHRRCFLYLPNPAETSEPVPLLTVFDAESWFTRLNLPAALEFARRTRGLPPVAVLGLTAADIPDRKATLGANPTFLRSVATAATEWAEEMAEGRGISLASPERRIVAGQSLGGLSVLCAARDLGEHYGHAISQSPSMWWTPDGASTPRDLGSCITPWVTGSFPASPEHGRRQPTIHLDVGLRESLTVPHLHGLAMQLEAAGWPHALHVYDGGHDNAWWRASLLDRLAEILVPSPE